MSTGLTQKQTQTRLRALSSALAGRGISVLHQDAAHFFDLAESLPPAWSSLQVIGRSDSEILPNDMAESFSAAVSRCLKSAEEQTISFELNEVGRRRQYEARMLPDEDGVTTIVTDVTDQLSRDAALASLLREVSHRSKNLLAIVQSVAMQTAHHSGGIKDFLDKFRGRLHALSSTQDLVTESNWRGTYLQSLVTSQMTRVGHSALAHLRITGDNPLLGPNASLHIGLAIHELAANAVLHGGLGDDRAGHVWVDARIGSKINQQPDLVIEWQETGISHGARHEPRFGTLVLERIVPLSVGGTAEFSINDDSVTYRLVVPADQFEA